MDTGNPKLFLLEIYFQVFTLEPYLIAKKKNDINHSNP